MNSAAVKVPDTILVLCHSFFHDAFRMQEPVAKVYDSWKSSVFIANLIIERQSEFPVGSYFAVTSKVAFDDFSVKFLGEKPSIKLQEMVQALRSSITIIDRPSVNNLSIDDSVLVICDTLYSCGSYVPILISNIGKKREKAENFYHKKDPETNIPYSIYTTQEAAAFLRGKFPDLSAIVDERTKM